MTTGHNEAGRQPEAPRRRSLPRARITPARCGQLRQAPHGDRRGRVVQRLLRSQLGQHRQGEAQRRVVARQPGCDLAPSASLPRHRRAPGRPARAAASPARRATRHGPVHASGLRPASASICSCSHGRCSASPRRKYTSATSIAVSLRSRAISMMSQHGLQVRQRRELAGERGRHALRLPVASWPRSGALRRRQDAPRTARHVLEAVVEARHRRRRCPGSRPGATAASA